MLDLDQQADRAMAPLAERLSAASDIARVDWLVVLKNAYMKGYKEGFEESVELAAEALIITKLNRRAGAPDHG